MKDVDCIGCSILCVCLCFPEAHGIPCLAVVVVCVNPTHVGTAEEREILAPSLEHMDNEMPMSKAKIAYTALL